MKITNKKARYNYQILDRYEAGIALAGAEVKSVLAGHIRLEEAFVRIIKGEAYLLNAHIPIYQAARPQDYNPTRTRKLLLHKNQLISLGTKISQKGLTLVPLACYNKHRKIKLEIGLARGKKQYEKRTQIKKRELQQEIARQLKSTKGTIGLDE